MAIDFNLSSLLGTSLSGESPWWQYILGGAGWTIALMVSAFLTALAIGLLIGTLRTLPHKGLRYFAEAWIEFFRNIPLLVQMFIWYYVLPELIPFYKTWITSVDPIYAQFFSAYICLAFFTSSRIAEQVRAGIQSLPKGLKSAACALGLHETQTYRYVILPMAFRRILPPLTSEATSLVKNTAVALTIGLPELTMRANDMGENTFAYFAAYCWATLLYVVIALSVTKIMGFIEKKSRIPGFLSNSAP